MKNLQNTPADEAKLLREASQRLANGDHRGAQALCLKVLQANPSAAGAHYLLGILASHRGDYQKSIELFDRALAADSTHMGSLVQKARSLIALQQRDSAVEAAEAAAALRPRDAHTLDTIGVVFSWAGLHERAVGFYEAATRTDPGPANYHYNLGAALQFVGRMEEACAAYEACLARAPNETRALSAMVNIKKQTEETNDLARLEAAFEATSSNPVDALRVGHALAKAHEDMAHADEALSWLRRAKVGKWASIAYDPAQDAALFDAAMALADRAGERPGYADGQPIFIVGMPRTGTTLVDRILSGHSLVTSAGELVDFGLALKQLARTPSNLVLDAETLAAATRVDPATLGRAYLDRVRTALGLSGHFIDKLPRNALYAPAILTALPNARIICLRRHPADTVLSNYRQLFATQLPYYDYAYDLEACARYYVGFDRMIRRFRERLPADRFREVRYEAVVADIEGETRAMLEFCGLEFEPACIAFHENKAPVATASAAQVREPLYTGSMGRWKRYEAGLRPALDVLQAAGCLDSAERTII